MINNNHLAMTIKLMAVKQFDHVDSSTPLTDYLIMINDNQLAMIIKVMAVKQLDHADSATPPSTHPHL